jgi:hypothetical protein
MGRSEIRMVVDLVIGIGMFFLIISNKLGE